MKELLYLIILNISLGFGYGIGWANDSWTKWISAPLICYCLGAFIRMFWGKP